MNDLQDAVNRYDDWMKAPKAVPEPTVAVLADAARRVANGTPMYRQGGLSGAWYVMAPDDTDEPDGWLIITEDTDEP